MARWHRAAAVAAPILILPLFLTIAGCKTPRADRESEAKAEFTDRQPGNGENWTQARITQFDKYAKDLLAYSGTEAVEHNEQQLIVEKWFADAAVKDPEPLSSYAIDLGPYGECFWEEGVRDYDIWWDGHRDEIKSQIENVAFFIRDYHYAMLGKNHGAFSFKRVILCPEKIVGTKMVLDGYNLFIGVPYGFNGYKVLTNKDLKKLWDDGYPIGLSGTPKGLFAKVQTLFSSAAKAKAGMLILWKIFNPLSTIRRGARKLLHENGIKLTQVLDRMHQRYFGGTNLVGIDPVVIRSELRQDILGSGGEAVVDTDTLAEEVMGAFDGLDAKGMSRLLKNWQCFMRDVTTRTDIEDDAMGLVQGDLRNEDNDIEKDVQAGLVAVVNHHRVGVRFATGTGTFKRYIPEGPASNRSTRIRTRVRAGLVAVDTSDDISVDVDLATRLGSTIQTAGFARGVQAAARGQDLCSGN